MTTHFALHLDVQRSEGTYEALTVAAPTILVGTAAHCDVRLGGTRSALEYVSIEHDGGVIFAHARRDTTPVSVNGQPLPRERTRIGREAVFVVAETRIVAKVIEIAPADKNHHWKRRFASAAVGLVLAALPSLVYAALHNPDEAPIGPPPNEVTPLFDRLTNRCPATAPDQALALATNARALAELQREQHPFAVRDGLAAVGSFDVASACFRDVRREAESRAAASARDALRARIEADYRVHRVRLEHAIDENDKKTAIREIRVLKSLTAGHKGAYVEWLDMVDRRIGQAANEAQP